MTDNIEFSITGLDSLLGKLDALKVANLLAPIAEPKPAETDQQTLSATNASSELTGSSSSSA